MSFQIAKGILATPAIMSVRILIDERSSGIFSPGQQIQARVEVALKTAAQRETINQVNLSFRGQSKITIKVETGTGDSKSTSYYYSTAFLFYRALTLTSPSYQPPASRRGEDGGTLTWHFQMEIPERIEPVHPDLVKTYKGDIFQPDNEKGFPGSLEFQYQPLPDSLPHFSSSRGPSKDIYGGLQYLLNAEVVGLPAGIKGLWIGNKDVEYEIQVRNSGPHVPMQIQWQTLTEDTTVRSLLLLPSHSDGHLTFREKTRSIFKKSSLPSIELALTFSMPETLLLDLPAAEELPFRINVRRVADLPKNTKIPDEKESRESNIPNPEVFLKKLELSLVAINTVRTPGIVPGSGVLGSRWAKGPTHHHEVAERSACFCSCKPKRKEEPMCEIDVGHGWFDIGARLNVCAGDLAQLAEVPRYGLVEDFTTPNLSRRYRLDWDIRLEIAGKEVKWKQGMPVRILNGNARNDDGSLEVVPKYTPKSFSGVDY